MDNTRPNSTAIAILAKAPIPGLAKTRLIPSLGAEGAAQLAEKLIARTVTTCKASAIGPMTLWVTPDNSHPLFAKLRNDHAIVLIRQPEGDLGARMHAAIAAANGPAIVVGTDCPALTVKHLRDAAEALQEHDAVVIPAGDGGYVLIGLKRPEPRLFASMMWSTASVMEETRRRLRELSMSWREPAVLWDVDTPADLERLRREGISV